MADTLSYAPSGAPTRGTSLVKIGGGLAVAGAIIGVFIFVLGCFGFGAAFALALLPTALGALGFVLVLLGGFAQKAVGMEDTAVLASLMISVAVIAGGLLEVAIWLNKPIFASSGGM